MSDITPERSATEPTVSSGSQEKAKYVSRRGRKMLMTLLAVLLVLLLISAFVLYQFLQPKRGASPAELKGVTWIRSIYGYGPNISQMTEPASVAIDPNGGTIWLSDQGDFRIIKYDPNGRYVGMFDGDRKNKDSFDYPSRIALAPDGWLYVAQSTYNSVKVYNPDGVLKQTLKIPTPTAVAVNNDMVIVGSQAGFAAYNRAGKQIGLVGTRGRGDTQFDTVNGVALDEESNAYIVDSFNNRISKYDAEGDRVWMVKTGVPGNRAEKTKGGSIATSNTAFPAKMQVPMGATLDGADRLVVVDLLDFSIAAFDTADGKFVGKWGDFGHTDGLFSYPADIDYDPAFDWFVVSDSGNQRAQIIRLPDSGQSATAAARRTLSGPLKACLFPLILLLLIVVAWVVTKNRRKRREGLAAETAGSLETPAHVSDTQ